MKEEESRERCKDHESISGGVRNLRVARQERFESRALFAAIPGMLIRAPLIGIGHAVCFVREIWAGQTRERTSDIVTSAEVILTMLLSRLGGGRMPGVSEMCECLSDFCSDLPQTVLLHVKKAAMQRFD